MGTLAIVYISLLDDEWKGQPRILTLRIFTVLQKYLLTYISEPSSFLKDFVCVASNSCFSRDNLFDVLVSHFHICLIPLD